MREQSPEYYFGLDIGTSAVRCVVATLDNATEENSQLSIVGQGMAPNLGMRKGSVVHVEDVASAIAQAIAEAERLSGVHIDHVTVNINGSHVVGINSKGVVAISNPTREIGIEDRFRVEEAATILKLPPNREIIQVFAKNYRVDGQDNIKDPVGMQGVRLEVDAHIVTAASPGLRLLENALNKANLHPTHRTVSSLAAAEAVLTRQQKEAGTLLLDIGCGTTNIVVIEDGEVQHVAVLPIGGINITNDLAIGLRTDLDIAEHIKIHSSGLATQAKKGVIGATIDGTKHEFPSEEVTMIIDARVEELFEYVDKELRKIQRSGKLPGGIVLVGGTAKLPGISEKAKDSLGLAARIGSLQHVSGLIESVSDPAYYSAVGLAMLDLLLRSSSTAPTHSTSSQGRRNVFGWAEELIKRVRR